MTGTKPIDEGSIGASQERRAKVRALIASGRWRQAEPDAPRAAAFDRARKTTASAEAIVGDTNDLQQVAFLLEGSRVRRAVAYVESNDARESRTGTGFLISDRLLPIAPRTPPTPSERPAMVAIRGLVMVHEAQVRSEVYRWP